MCYTLILDDVIPRGALAELPTHDDLPNDAIPHGFDIAPKCDWTLHP